jgi:hypothetical protein
MAIVETCPVHGETFFSYACGHIVASVASGRDSQVSCLFVEGTVFLCPRCAGQVGSTTDLLSLDPDIVCTKHLEGWLATRTPSVDLRTAVRSAREVKEREKRRLVRIL